MATAERHPTYRNILLVTGEDIAGDDPRQALIDALEASGSSAPVRRGTHDIWVTYQVATQSGANHSFGDEAAAPRPRRGVVQMGVPPTDSSEASLQDQIGTMLQECGHSWLVPYELGIRDASAWPAPQQPYLMPSDVEVATAQADGSPYTGPLLLGRTNQHWSTFFDGDGSPFDGMHWRELPDADGVVRWQWDAPPTYAIAPPGLGSISLGARYNDLDLLVMGVKTAQEAYAARSNRFRWLEPQLMAPIEYHAGVCIAFGPGDFHYCGFYRDHQTVGVQATGGALTSYPLPDYRRFGRGEERLALRVLKRGSQYHYQVRRDHPAGTPLSARLLDALDPIPSAGAPVTLDTWQTIATLTHAGSPLAVGTIVKTWSD